MNGMQQIRARRLRLRCWVEGSGNTGYFRLYKARKKISAREDEFRVFLVVFCLYYDYDYGYGRKNAMVSQLTDLWSYVETRRSTRWK